MKTLFRLVLALVVIPGAAASAAQLPTAAGQCLSQGGDCSVAVPTGSDLTVYTVIWDNGGFNGVNGLSSERATVISGIGGPEGDHAATSADDFQVPSAVSDVEFHACVLASANVTSAEMYVWADAAGTPALPVTTTVLGGPTTASIVSSTFARNSPYCRDAFGFEGRLYLFNANTTGVTLSLPAAGTYWFAVVGEDAGAGRAFFATSSPADPLAPPVFGSSVFGVPYWSPGTDQIGDLVGFSFRVVQASEGTTQAIPALGAKGFALLAGLLVAAALVALRLRR